MKSVFQLTTTLWALFLTRIIVTTEAQLVPEVVESDPELEMFSNALEVAGLESTLATGGPYTVFGPNNDAFSNLDPKYMQPEWNAHLTEILLQHVHEGPPSPFLTESWEVGSELVPLSGVPLTVTSVDPFAINDNYTVVTPDAIADNGVIHTVDAVILPPSAQDTIIDIINVIPEFFSTLALLLEEAGLVEALQVDGPFTLFAPSNDAFEALGPDVLANLQADQAALSNVLLYHVVPGIWLADTLLRDNPFVLPTLQGSDLPNPSDIIEFGDLLAKNGVLHIMNEVLIPPEGEPATVESATVTEGPTAVAGVTETPAVTEAPSMGGIAAQNDTTTQTNSTIVDLAIAANFTVMVSALNQTIWLDLLQGDGPYTVFAVPNDGFAALPPKFVTDPQWNSHLANVLTYHVLPVEAFAVNLTDNATFPTLNFNSLTVTSGSPLQVNGINVTATDIIASNGVIHVVEEVLLPPSATDTAIDLIANFDQFSTLFSLLNATNLTSALDGEGPLTIAAPVNSAFEDLPEGTLESLAADPVLLRDILLYHVVPELVEFPTVADNGTTFTTLQGQDLTFYPVMAGGQEENMMIGEAIVLFGDLLVQNGLVQVIDQVLIPPAPEPISTAPPSATMATTDAQTMAPTGMATTVATPMDTTMTTTMAPTGMTTPMDTTMAPTDMATPMDTTLTITMAPTDMATMMDATMNATVAPTTTPVDGATASPTTASVTVADAVQSDPKYSILFELLELADLVDTLDTTDPLTLFAPNNAAFDRLPSGLLDSLRAKVDNLSNILLYHAITDLLLSTDLVDGQLVSMAQGDLSTISLNPAMINDANILAVDSVYSNGAIHEIDTVLIPPQATDPPVETAAPTVAPTVAPMMTASPTQTTAATAAPSATTIVIPPPDDNCVNIPGVQVCCPPGQTDGVFFFCRYL